MRKISYKCKNCGASVKNNNNKSVLTCAYCNTTYDNFIKSDDISIDNLVDRLEIYSYKCLCCGEILNSYKKIQKPLCSKCNSDNISESFQLVNGAIFNELADKFIINDFKGELVGVEKFVPEEFFNDDFSLKYIKSKVYDGVINITAKSFTGKTVNRKYVLFDLIVPDSDTLNYSDMFHVMSNKIHSGKMSYEKKSLESIPVERYEINDRKNSDISEISKVCLNDFKNRYKGCTSISVELNVDVQYNFYIPMFQKFTVYNGKKYYNSIVGFRDKNNDGSNFCLNFPPLNSSQKRELKAMLFLNIVKIVLWFIVGFFFLHLCISSSKEIYIFLLLTFLSLAKAISLISKCRFLARQIYVYFNDKKLTKNEFYNELIKEKNKFIYQVNWR